jgi:hypothetical protein
MKNHINNDDKILEIRRKIESKEKLINSNECIKFKPKTSCRFELRGMPYNINTLSPEQLLVLSYDLTALRDFVESKGLLDSFTIETFKIDDILSDCENKCTQKELQIEKRKLAQLQIELDSLLSNDKKTELRLSDIEKLI